MSPTLGDSSQRRAPHAPTAELLPQHSSLGQEGELRAGIWAQI